ncbi:hypothetical protein NPIL_121611 [Nephila pilipes]|uniref:Uncharacterized protein n=1 Tax=Nephila pilipes TaxID=299642 RepID=A0A8X6J3E2_NEPPI|nr:hypothetical protein NPIL_121611 [Nephila pilipes]
MNYEALPFGRKSIQGGFMTQSRTMVPVIPRNYLLSAEAKTTSGQFYETISGGPFIGAGRFCPEIKALREEGGL